jgi:hypothetical protein
VHGLGCPTVEVWLTEVVGEVHRELRSRGEMLHLVGPEAVCAGLARAGRAYGSAGAPAADAVIAQIRDPGRNDRCAVRERGHSGAEPTSTRVPLTTTAPVVIRGAALDHASGQRRRAG